MYILFGKLFFQVFDYIADRAGSNTTSAYHFKYTFCLLP